MKRWLMLIGVLLSSPAWGTTYYVSSLGSNSNNGLTAAAPFQTFAYAINPARASCGDTLMVRDGFHGDASTSGKLAVSSLLCTLGDELTIRAENQRQAVIYDFAISSAASITDSAYIIIDGLVLVSTDNSATTASGIGEPLTIRRSNHIIARNLVVSNPNRYANTHAIDILNSSQVLIEDSEAYVFHRHCVLAWQSSQVTVRRQYCNPRGGKVSGGFGLDQGPLGSGAALVSMYPCQDCAIENSIADGTTHPMYLNEMNATGDGGTLMSGSKVLGSICYKCNYGNGIYLNSRKAADLNHTPQNITIRDVALVDWGSTARGVRVSDGVNITLDHLSIFSDGSAVDGIFTEDAASVGVTASSNSITMTNLLVTGLSSSTGLRIAGFNTWSGDEIFSTGNAIAFSPSLPSNWTNTSTASHGMGNCRVFVPDGAAVQGAGTGGGDIGANILYRYVDGVLTTTPLWDPTTGEFPHGADDALGLNTVAGESLKDIHTRLNVNTGGCSFPSSYATGGTPGNPAAYVSSTGTTSTSHEHTVAEDSLTVLVAMYHSGGAVGSVSSVTASGEALMLLESCVTSPAYRTVEIWGKISPTAGSRTIAVSTTGNVTGMVTTSITKDDVSAYGEVACTTALSATPSVTVNTNTGETILDALAGKKLSLLTAGPDQTLNRDDVHGTADIRLSTSTQDGADGGVMSYTMGTSNYWALGAVSLIPGTPSPPETFVLTQTKYQILYPYGSEANAPAKAAVNTAARVRPTGLVRIRAEITGSVDTTTPFNAALYCRKNADSYARVMNTFGSNPVRFYGPGVEASNPQVPPSLTSTTQRLSSGNYMTGALIRDEISVFTVPALVVGAHIEMDAVLILNAAPGDTIDCRWQKDDGSQLSAYTVTPRLTVVPATAGAGF